MEEEQKLDPVENENIEVAEDEQNEDSKEPSKPIDYSCCKCRKILFNTDDLVVEHTSEVKKFNMSNKRRAGTVFDKNNCTSYFIEQKEWIDISEGHNSGKIKCPHCDAKLGSYTLSGAQCSCGRWMIPAFQIHKNKVDEKKIIVLNLVK